MHTAALDGFEADEVVRLAACAERGASHPLAAAVVGLAASRGLALNSAVTNSSEVPGQVGKGSCQRVNFRNESVPSSALVTTLPGSTQRGSHGNLAGQRKLCP